MACEAEWRSSSKIFRLRRLRLRNPDLNYVFPIVRRRNARSSRTSESAAANAAVLSARRLPYWVRAISMPEEYEPETGRFLPVDRYDFLNIFVTGQFCLQLSSVWGIHSWVYFSYFFIHSKNKLVFKYCEVRLFEFRLFPFPMSSFFPLSSMQIFVDLIAIYLLFSYLGGTRRKGIQTTRYQEFYLF